MTVGERPLDPEERRLVEDAACAVSAAQLAAFDLQAPGERVVGLVQQVYWDGSDPGSARLPRSPSPGAKRCGAWRTAVWIWLWLPYERPEFDIELPCLDVHGDPALRRTCGALVEHIVAHDRRLRDAAGVPVTGEDPDGGMVSGAYEPVAEQLTADERQAWASRGWIELDPSRSCTRDRPLRPHGRGGRHLSKVRAPVRDDAHLALGGARDSTGRSPWSAARPLSSPGCCRRARSAPGRTDLFGRWHEAVAAERTWLAVLPHEGRGGPPPVEFLAADGTVVERVDAAADDSRGGVMKLFVTGPVGGFPSRTSSSIGSARRRGGSWRPQS